MKKFLAVVLTTIALAAPSLSVAQIGNMLGGLGASKSSGASAGADLGAQQDSLVRNYVAAGKDVLTANSYFADVFDVSADVEIKLVRDTKTVRHVVVPFYADIAEAAPSPELIGVITICGCAD